MTGPAVGDAFGAALRRCWAAGVAAGVAHEVVERDDGFIDVADVVRYFAPVDEWPVPDRWAAARVAGRVLDVGCGAGRHALVLAHHGHDVVGVDSSPGAVEVARARGVTAVVGAVERLPGDLGLFDTILLLGNNLGLLANAAHARVVLTALGAVTAPGGRLLGTGFDPLRTDDEVHRAYHRRNTAVGRLPGQIRLRVRDGAVATEWFDYLFLPPDALPPLLGGTPWRLRHVHRAGAAYAVHLDRIPGQGSEK